MNPSVFPARWRPVWCLALLLFLGFAAVPGLRAAQTFVADLSSPGEVVVTATAAHPTDGSTYVAGYFNNSPLKIQHMTLNLVSNRTTAFLARMNADGGWEWAGTLADSNGWGSLTIRGLTVGPNNVYVCGDLKGGLLARMQQNGVFRSGSATLPRTNHMLTPFAANFNAENGAFVWAAIARNGHDPGTPGEWNAYGHALAVDGNGGVYVCGSFRSGSTEDNTGPDSSGLNFGTNHAFRARDPSGVGTSIYNRDTNPGGTDWNHVTRDGFVAKLNPAGAWQWVVTGGSSEDEFGGFFAIAVNNQSEVYVAGSIFRAGSTESATFWNRGTTRAVWNGTISNNGTYGFGPNHPGRLTTWVGQIYGEGSNEGKWIGAVLGNNANPKNTTQANIALDVGENLYVRGLVWNGGQVFVCGQYASSGHLGVFRMPGNLASLDRSTMIKAVGTRHDMGPGPSLGFDVNNNIYLAGTFGSPEAQFLGAANVVDLRLFVTAGRGLFAAKLDRDLNWQWAQSSTEVAGSIPSLNPASAAVHRDTGRQVIAGSFANGFINFGPPTSDTQLPVGDNPRGPSAASFVTALVQTGDFLSQVQLNVETEVGADLVRPGGGQQTVFRGTETTVSVVPLWYEDQDGNAIIPGVVGNIVDAVVRHTCTGYEFVNSGVSGDSASVTFNINADTTVRFNWLTEYALVVTNNLTGTDGGLTSQAAGNPDPVVQKHWIPKDQFVTAFVDGLTTDPDKFDDGVRYRTTGYLAAGPSSGLGSAFRFTNNTHFVDVPDVDLTGRSITVEFWSREPATSGGYMFSHGDTEADLAMVPWNATQYLMRYTDTELLVPRPTDTNWHHHAIVFDNTTRTMVYYQDGRQLGSIDRIAPMTAGGRLRLGQYVGGGCCGYEGALDDFRIWSTNRTAAEIAANRMGSLSGQENGLQVYLPLDERGGQTVANLADSTRPGTLLSYKANFTPDASQLRLKVERFIPWASVQSRQQVPEFLMTGPAAIEYFWVKEVRLQVSVAPAALSESISVAAGGVTNFGTGETWFLNRTRVRVNAPRYASAANESYELSGYTSGLGDVKPFSGPGTLSGTNRYYEIPGLTNGSAISWDYGSRVYRGTVVIGSAVDFSANGTFRGTEAIPESDMLDAASPPVGSSIVSGSPAGSTVQDMWIWDDVADRLLPLRPGVILVEWGRRQGASTTRSIVTELTVVYPTNAPSYQHIANTPPVPLDADETNTMAFLELKFSERNARVDDIPAFTATDPGWSVLLFSESTNGLAATGAQNVERLLVRTVYTRAWNAAPILTTNVTVGATITSTFHDARVPHNGYVFFEKSRYNPEIHQRATRQGPIIAVNRPPLLTAGDQLVVVWYRITEGLAWPYQSVRYLPEFPADSPSRIVIASRLGSEGIDTSGQSQISFSPDRYEQVKIYNQPDRTRAGFNPNEEHALIAGSLLRSSDAVVPPTAYALRNNLNLTNRSLETYTSDPYVLVQFFDRLITNYGMAVYRVVVEDTNFAARRLEFPVTAATGTNLTRGAGGQIEFNVPAFTAITGLRADEPVDLMPNENLVGVNAGRYYIRRVDDNRFTLSLAPGGAAVTGTIVTNADYPRVVVTRAFPCTFEYQMTAGEPVLAPHPVQQLIGGASCTQTRGENIDPGQLVYWEDHKKQPWAVSGSQRASDGLRAQFFYPMQSAFWHPTVPPGDCLPFVSDTTVVWVTNHVAWPSRVPVLKAGESLTFSGGEINADDANKPGVPGLVGWAAGKIVYDDANPNMDPTRVLTHYLARLASPLLTVEVPLPVAQLPAELQPAAGKVTVIGTAWTFNDLGPSLQPRVRYDQSSQKLSVHGYLNGKTLGDAGLTAAPGSISILQPNILSDTDSNALVNLVRAPSPEWVEAVGALVRRSRDPNDAAEGRYAVGVEKAGTLIGQWRQAVQFGPGLALLPNQGLLDPVANLREGYVTLAENDDDALGAAPVSLRILRIRKQPLFRGAIKTINPPNPFDEQVNLRHSGDFGGNAGDLVFDWRYRPDDGQVVPPPDESPADWLNFPTPREGRGAQEINLAGAGTTTLTDNRFFVRWRHVRETNAWSQWAGAANSRPPATNELARNTYVPQLAEGWVKRVIAGINPFDARIQDFRNNNSPATYASMVQQAGSPYRGPVALNPDKDVIENTGLIELYTTVLQRARGLSIDLSSPVSTPAVNNTLLLAASRIADLQLLLGNEASTDAQDSTIGFGSSSVEYGSLAPTIFCFQNQVASLLDEELALLRGRPEEGAYPAYNRLLWNFTRAEGEAAYALSYAIKDVNVDGFINEADSRIMFPQGHGDAWGHYLAALKTYYDLLRHPHFNWQSRSENLQIDGVVVAVDYLDERKFAQAAAAKAKAGAEIVNLTYRSRYVEDPDGQWQGYQDTDPSRGWGVADWARRAGTGALLDWVASNAILPAEDPYHTGIQKVDRTTVKELSEISAQALEIRRHLDNSNVGLNPLGLSSDVLPFDIDPSFLEVGSVIQGQSHFDQVYLRALKALQNALDLFDHANQLNQMLRQVAASAEQFAQDAQDQDIDHRNRLIEIFGTPYEGTIGPGRAYPAGYSGPDIYLYMYADVTGVSEETVPPPSETFQAFFQPFDGGFIKLPGGEAGSVTAAFRNYYGYDVDLADTASTDYSEVLTLNMPRTASGYSFQAPAEWGQRRSPGEVQQVLSELVQAEADLNLGLADYDAHMGAIQELIDLIKAQSDLGAEVIDIRETGRDVTRGLNATIGVLQTVSGAFATAAEIAADTADATVTSVPAVVGLASDPFSTVRGAIKNIGNLIKQNSRAQAFVAERAAAVVESEKEIAELQREIDIEKAEFRYAIQEQLRELTGMLGEEPPKRVDVLRRQEALRQVSDKYRSVLEKGLRVMEERTLHNKRTAGATQQNRYQDFTFRIARNQALSKYKAAFDLAARYAYMAAKAYDYETNLDPNNPASARPILNQIIRARTLGAIANGEPRLGSGGLADALAALKVNFEVLRTQMGFNNPQGESGQFSLRNELFRMGSSNDLAWRQQLEKFRKADLWQVPEFRRYCRPFAPQSAGAQPGLVIPFSSQIIFGKNFFGWPLGPGDSAYDPTLFATKIRSVGVWFDNYAGDGLSTTPRVYLVPTGLDIMYSSGSLDLATREWNVVDQRIPVPFPVGQAALRDPNWIPLRDSLNGTVGEIRRYSSFRAYHNAGFSEDEMSQDTRLIGRSVWNTQWMLIIPGGTFLADQTDGLDTFIYGLKAADGPATDSRGARRDGNGVQDIKLSFTTYAISGN